MKFEILGKRKSTFKQDNGSEMTGTIIYGSYVNPNVEGLCTTNFFVKTNIEDYSNIIVGDSVDLFFNRFGKIELIVSENDR